MTSSHPLHRFLIAHSGRSALLYAMLVLVLLLTSFFSLTKIVQGYRSLSTATEILARIERHTANSSSVAPDSNLEPVGSPFLEGSSLTVAGASLLQRVTDIVTRAGGTVVSSEIEPQSQAKDGFVRVVTVCELDQPALQQILYGLEAGKPLLFIDQLVAQATATGEDARIRVSLRVTGQWGAGK